MKIHSDTPHGPFVLHKEDHPKSEINLKKSVSRNINGNCGKEFTNRNDRKEHPQPQRARSTSDMPWEDSPRVTNVQKVAEKPQIRAI